MPHTGKVFDYFNDGLTAELAKLNLKSILYIGWRGDCSPWWHTRFVQELGIEKIAILEIYPPNAAQAKHVFSTVITGDARNIERHVKRGEYDLIFWDHGPEHVSEDDLRACTPKLVEYAGKALLYCCPWGNWPQGPEGGNEAEVHYDVKDTTLVELGMSVVRFGGEGQQLNGELIGLVTK